MSLLLEALKRAEAAKQQGGAEAAAAAPAEGSVPFTLESPAPTPPLMTRDKLPDITQPLEILSDDLPSSAGRAAPAASPQTPAPGGTMPRNRELRLQSDPPPATPGAASAGAADRQVERERRKGSGQATVRGERRGLRPVPLHQDRRRPRGRRGRRVRRLSLLPVAAAFGDGGEHLAARDAAASGRRAAAGARTAPVAAAPAAAPIAAAPAPSPVAAAPAVAVAPSPASTPAAPAVAAAPATPGATVQAARPAPTAIAQARPAPPPAADPGRGAERPVPAAPRPATSRNAATVTAPGESPVDRGYRALEQGDLQTARQEYNRALQVDKWNRDALLGLAAIDMRTQNYAAAEARYARVLEVDPRDPYAQAGMVSLRGQSRSGAGREPAEEPPRRAARRELPAFHARQPVRVAGALERGAGSVLQGALVRSRKSGLRLQSRREPRPDAPAAACAGVLPASALAAGRGASRPRSTRRRSSNRVRELAQ